MWELNYKESWVLKNLCFWTVVLEKTLESPLDCKEIQPVHPKGDQSWVFIRRTDVEAETPILWPPDAKRWLIWKDPNAGEDWRQEEKETSGDGMVGWHHQLNGHEFEQAPGVRDGQEAWRAVVHRVTKSQTRLSYWTELNWFNTLCHFSIYFVQFWVISYIEVNSVPNTLSYPETIFSYLSIAYFCQLRIKYVYIYTHIKVCTFFVFC